MLLISILNTCENMFKRVDAIINVMELSLREHSNHNTNQQIEDNLCKFHMLTLEQKQQVYDYYKNGDKDLSDNSNTALKLLLKRYMNIMLLEDEQTELDRLLDECLSPKSLEDIDICWLLFFVSGNLDYVNIIKLVKDDEHANQDLREAAKWSYTDIKRHFYPNI